MYLVTYTCPGCVKPTLAQHWYRVETNKEVKYTLQLFQNDLT